MASLDQIKSDASALSAWAHCATVGADGEPDVSPVHPAWDGDTLWFMTFAGGVKLANLEAQPKVALHWQVTEAGDGVEVWGTATVHEDVETKRRLWKGVFDYDLDAFSPGGPDDSPGTLFVSVEPERAVSIKAYGIGGIERWSR